MEIVIDHLHCSMINLHTLPVPYLAHLNVGIASFSLPIFQTCSEDQTRAFNHQTDVYQEPTVSQVQCQLLGAS